MSDPQPKAMDAANYFRSVAHTALDDAARGWDLAHSLQAEVAALKAEIEKMKRPEGDGA